MVGKKVLLDTDIGTDVDDCLALALLLVSPEVQLEGITCVYGDVSLRARIVQKLLSLRGSDHIPIFMGAEVSLLNRCPPYWEGHEGEGLLDPSDPPLYASRRHAVNFIIELVMANPGQIHLLAIGPLTNVALALRLEPRLAQALARLYLMGGVLRARGEFELGYTEHNIRSDPEAAHIVLSSGAAITLVPMDVTTLTRIHRHDVERIRSKSSPYHAAVADQVSRYPRFSRQGWTYLHDPLAAALVVNPALANCDTLHVEVELEGRLSRGATLARVTQQGERGIQVVREVDAPRFERWLIDRLCS